MISIEVKSGMRAYLSLVNSTCDTSTSKERRLFSCPCTFGPVRLDPFYAGSTAERPCVSIQEYGIPFYIVNVLFAVVMTKNSEIYLIYYLLFDLLFIFHEVLLHVPKCNR